MRTASLSVLLLSLALVGCSLDQGTPGSFSTRTQPQDGVATDGGGDGGASLGPCVRLTSWAEAHPARGTLTCGERCVGAQDCEFGLCIGIAPDDRHMCTNPESCEGVTSGEAACPSGFRCDQVRDFRGDLRHLCVPDDVDLCPGKGGSAPAPGGNSAESEVETPSEAESALKFFLWGAGEYVGSQYVYGPGGHWLQATASGDSHLTFGHWGDGRADVNLFRLHSAGGRYVYGEFEVHETGTALELVLSEQIVQAEGGVEPKPLRRVFEVTYTFADPSTRKRAPGDTLTLVERGTGARREYVRSEKRTYCETKSNCDGQDLGEGAVYCPGRHACLPGNLCDPGCTL